MRSYLCKTLLWAGVAVLSLQMAHAQKIRSEFVKVQYTQLPLKPLPKTFQSCQATIETDIEFPGKSGPGLVGTKESETEKNIFLQGMEKVESNADITVLLKLGEFQVFDKDNIRSFKDEKGIRLFFSETLYNLPATLTLTDKTGKVLIEKILVKPGQGRSVYFGESNNTLTDGPGGRFTSREDVKKYHDQYFLSTVLKRILDMAKNEIAEVNQQTIEKNFTFYTAEDKKQDYKDLDEAQKYAIEALNMINDKDSEADIKAQFQKAIAIWDKAIAQANLNDSKARINEKVHKMLHYNVTLAYMLTQDFGQARKYLSVGKTFKAPMPFIRGMDAYNAERDQKHIEDQFKDQEARFKANQS